MHPRTPSSLERMSASVMTWRPLPPHEHSPLICERERRSGWIAGERAAMTRGARGGKKYPHPVGGSCGYGPEGPQTAGRARRGGASSRLGRRRTPALGSGRKKRVGRTRRDPGATGGIAASRVSRSARATSASTAFQTRRPIGSGESFLTLTATCCCVSSSPAMIGCQTLEGRFMMTYGDPLLSSAGKTSPNPSRPAPKCTWSLSVGGVGKGGETGDACVRSGAYVAGCRARARGAGRTHRRET